MGFSFKKPEEYEAAVEQVAATSGITLTAEQIKDIIVSAIAEARKPTPEQLEAKAKEDEKKRREQQARIDVGRAEEQRRTAEQARCNHKKPRGEPRIGGQLHSDGKVHIICLGCQKELNVYTPSGPELAQIA